MMDIRAKNKIVVAPRGLDLHQIQETQTIQMRVSEARWLRMLGANEQRREPLQTGVAQHSMESVGE